MQPPVLGGQPEGCASVSPPVRRSTHLTCAHRSGITEQRDGHPTNLQLREGLERGSGKPDGTPPKLKRESMPLPQEGVSRGWRGAGESLLWKPQPGAEVLTSPVFQRMSRADGTMSSSAAVRL